MRILHITNSLSEGGVESFLLQLLPEIAGKGYDVDILVLDKNKIALKPVFEQKGIKVWVGKNGSVYNPWNIYRIRKFARFYDLVHVHLWPSQLWAGLAKKMSKANISFITTEHNTFNKRRKYRFYRPVEQWMYSQYETIIGVCDASRDNLLQWIRHKRIVSIPNGIQCELFSQANPYAKADLDLPENSFVITMTARFFEQKDHLTLIQALAWLPEYVHLLLIGSGSTERRCRQEAEELQLSERIHFLGRRSDVARILKSSDICVLSTHFEGLPISVLEYMAAGKAVVATDVEGVRELIVNPLLLTLPGNSKDMALKIKYLMDDPQYRLKVASENFVKVQKYSVESMVENYLSIYLSR